jgi:UMP-CMP kinase
MKKSGKNKFLLDGFPRDKENVDEWQKTMNDKYYIQCVLIFECDEKTSLNRCLERGKESGRNDDNEESLKKR